MVEGCGRLLELGETFVGVNDGKITGDGSVARSCIGSCYHTCGMERTETFVQYCMPCAIKKGLKW